MAAIIETVRAHLRNLGVATEHIDDLMQEVMLAAWEKVSEGAFRIEPGVQEHWAMQGWLFGIAWRQWSHYRDRAHWRREVLTPEPWREARSRSVEPLPALEARSALRCLRRLKESALEALLTDTEDLRALASKDEVSLRAISARRTTARRRFLALVEHLAEQEARAAEVAEEKKVEQTAQGSPARDKPIRGKAKQVRRKRPRPERTIQTRDEAFRELLQPRTYRLIVHWSRRLGVAPADVADVAQDVLVHAHRSFSGYDPQRGKLTQWLNRITVHVASHYHDRACRRREAPGLDEATEPQDLSPGAVELFLRAEVQQLIFDCLQAVPAAQRQVIVAHDFDEIPMKEIARQRGISLSAAYRLHTEGRLAFKTILLARVCLEEEKARGRGRRGYH